MINEFITAFKKSFSSDYQMSKMRQIDIQVDTIKRLFDHVDINELTEEKKYELEKMVNGSKPDNAWFISKKALK